MIFRYSVRVFLSTPKFFGVCRGYFDRAKNFLSPAVLDFGQMFRGRLKIPDPSQNFSDSSMAFGGLASQPSGVIFESRPNIFGLFWGTSRYLMISERFFGI